MMTIYEATIGNYFFKYTGNKITEIYKCYDKTQILREIILPRVNSEKDFQKEISFWFMENSKELL